MEDLLQSNYGHTKKIIRQNITIPAVYSCQSRAEDFIHTLKFHLGLSTDKETIPSIAFTGQK